MNCRKVNNLLSAYIDNELAGVEQLQIRQHLRDCCACNAEHESLLTTKRMLSGLSMQGPRIDLEKRILETVKSDGVDVRHTNLRAWWSVLAEPQRASLRLGALFGVFSLVAAVYVAGPLRRPQPAPGALALSPSPSRTEARNEVSVRDYLIFHHSSEEGQPMSSGSAIVPAGMSSASFSSR